MNCILFSASFGGCYDFKNMRGMNRIRTVANSFSAFLTAGLHHPLKKEL
jgi:hypothetical protein